MIPGKKGGGIGGIAIWDRWDRYLGPVGSVLGTGGIGSWDRWDHYLGSGGIDIWDHMEGWDPEYNQQFLCKGGNLK